MLEKDFDVLKKLGIFLCAEFNLQMQQNSD